MTIAIIGAGAIGSVVAGLLHRAGVEVCLIGREDQVDAINQNGLTVKGVEGEFNVKLKALTQLDKKYDLVIFTTKTQDIEAAYQHNSAHLEGCNVLSSQNGVQADTMLGFHFEQRQMLSSIVMFGATYTKPGEVVYNFPGDWIVGKPYSPVDPITHEIADQLKKAFPVVITHDINGMKWLKLFVNFNNCIPALTGRSMQETFSDMDFCRLSVMLLKEGYDIVSEAKIKLVSLPNFPVERISGMANMPVDQAAGIINKTLTTLSKEPLYGSILQSIMRKRTSEIDFINGEVTALASQIKLQAPLNSKVVEMVHEVEKNNKHFASEEIKEAFNLN